MKDQSKLPIDSVGTCSECGYQGPGPGHECNSYNRTILCEKKDIYMPTKRDNEIMEELSRLDTKVAEPEKEKIEIEWENMIMRGALSDITHQRRGCFMSHPENWEPNSKSNALKSACVEKSSCFGCTFADIAEKAYADMNLRYSKVPKPPEPPKGPPVKYIEEYAVKRR